MAFWGDPRKLLATLNKKPMPQSGELANGLSTPE
jgi:hypothetical protein